MGGWEEYNQLMRILQKSFICMIFKNKYPYRACQFEQSLWGEMKSLQPGFGWEVLGWAWAEGPLEVGKERVPGIQSSYLALTLLGIHSSRPALTLLLEHHYRAGYGLFLGHYVNLPAFLFLASFEGERRRAKVVQEVSVSPLISFWATCPSRCMPACHVVCGHR